MAVPPDITKVLLPLPDNKVNTVGIFPVTIMTEIIENKIPTDAILRFTTLRILFIPIRINDIKKRGRVHITISGLQEYT